MSSFNSVMSLLSPNKIPDTPGGPEEIEQRLIYESFALKHTTKTIASKLLHVHSSHAGIPFPFISICKSNVVSI